MNRALKTGYRGGREVPGVDPPTFFPAKLLGWIVRNPSALPVGPRTDGLVGPCACERVSKSAYAPNHIASAMMTNQLVHTLKVAGRLWMPPD